MQTTNLVEFYLEEPLKAGDSILVDASPFGLKKKEIGTLIQIYPEKGTLKVIFENGQMGVFLEEEVESLEFLIKQQPQELLEKIAESKCWCKQLKKENFICPRCKMNPFTVI
ncbi:MAG: hypothetical protein AABZ60_02400 [Planctomycetota bacterium]